MASPNFTAPWDGMGIGGGMGEGEAGGRKIAFLSYLSYLAININSGCLELVYGTPTNIVQWDSRVKDSGII